MKLTPEQARGELAKALRSEKYKQGIGRLREGDQFCCLGVACDIYRKIEGKGEWVTLDNPDAFGFITVSTNIQTALPWEVQQWLGFDTASGDLRNSKETLAHLNDSGATFEEAAALIEDGKVSLL